MNPESSETNTPPHDGADAASPRPSPHAGPPHAGPRLSLGPTGEDAASPRPSRRPLSADRKMWLGITVMVMLWAVAMFYRAEIRARWWAHKIAATDDPRVRLIYFQRLASLGDSAVGAAESLLAHPSPEVRSAGIGALHTARTKRARDLLVKALSDPDPDNRSLAALGLAFFRDESIVPALVELLHGPDPAPASSAAVALGRIGGDQASHALIHALSADLPAEVRVEVIDQLASLRATQAVGALIECLEDERRIPGGAAGQEDDRSETVADHAGIALRMITGESFGYQSSADPETRRTIIEMWRTWHRERQRG